MIYPNNQQLTKWLSDAGFKDLAAKTQFEVDETEFNSHLDQLELSNCPEAEWRDRAVFRCLTMGQPVPLKGIPMLVEQARIQILEDAAMNRRLFIRISILVVALLLFILAFSIKGHAEGQGSSVNPALTVATCSTSALAAGIRSPLYVNTAGTLCTSAGGTGSSSVTINNTSGNAAIVTFLTSNLAVTCTGCSSASAVTINNTAGNAVITTFLTSSLNVTCSGCSSASAVTVSNTTGSALFVTLLTSSLSVTSTPAAGTTTVVSFLTSTLPVSIGSTITATFLTSSLSVTSTPAAGTVAVVSFLTSTLPVSIGSTVTTTFLTSTLSVTSTPAAGTTTVVSFLTSSPSVTTALGSVTLASFLTSSLAVTTTPAAGAVTVIGFQTANIATNIAQIAGSTIATAATGIAKVGLTDGSGNAITSTSSALDVNIKSASITQPVSLAATVVTSFLTSSILVTSTPASGAVTTVTFLTSSLSVTTTQAAGAVDVVSFRTSSLAVTTTPAAGATTVVSFLTASILTSATLSAETTKVIGTVRVTGNVGAVFDGATGAAPPANVVYMGGINSGATGGLLGGIPVCDTFGAISITTATTTLVVTGVSGRNVYICNLFLTNNAADNVALVSGTGATCGTGTAAISGGLTPTNGIYLAANGGFSVGVGLGAVMKTKAAGDSVCIGTSAATQLSGSIGYVIYYHMPPKMFRRELEW